GRTGSETELLIEGRSRRGATWQGRDPYNACVNVPLPGDGDFTGRLARVEITEARHHSLFARPAGDA
ncbi:MAG: TRAM domain-containing protein, partial [Desulfovibrio sp.]|nr:TRAM domain-containing protein [Desulfovibrio sp.]